MKRFFYLFALITISVSDTWGQDPQFTQFYSVPLYLGPSFAGATQQHRLSTTFRRQWTAIPGGYGTYVIAYDHYFAKYNSGLGLLLMQDQAGSGRLGNKYSNLSYSYDFILLNTIHVRPGLSFIYSMYGVDFSRLYFGDQIIKGTKSPTSIETNPTKEIRGNIDGAFSSLIYTEKMWFGLTIDHLLQPNISFYGEKSLTPLRYTFYGGAKLVSKGRLLKPVDESISLAYQYRVQGAYKQLDIGLYWFQNPLVFGFWYRGLPLINSNRGDAVAFLLGLKMYQFSVAYSFDFTVSNLINSTSGAHEVSLIFEFQTKRKKKYHAIPCPEF